MGSPHHNFYEVTNNKPHKWETPNLHLRIITKLSSTVKYKIHTLCKTLTGICFGDMFHPVRESTLLRDIDLLIDSVKEMT